MTDLLSEIRDGVGIITLNRPEKLNAISVEMRDGLVSATQAFEKDPEVRAVLITGAGDNFMAGGDVESFHRSLMEEREAHLAGMEQRIINGHLLIHRIRRMPKPVVVAVQGAVAGFGLSLVCAADLAIASDDAFFLLAYRHIGLTSDGGASYFLPRIVGERRATEIALLGERFMAQQAHDWGLVNRIVPVGAARDEGFKLAAKLAAGPTRALAGFKRLLRTSLQTSWDEQSALEAEMIAEMIGTEDHLEGVTAFLEKRKANFTGR